MQLYKKKFFSGYELLMKNTIVGFERILEADCNYAEKV